MLTFKQYLKENNDNKPKRDYGTKENLEQSFLLIIVDVFLAGDNTGIDFVTQFDHNVQKKIIVTSSIPQNKFESLCQENNIVCSFLGKPIHIPTVMNIINRILGASHKVSKSDFNSIKEELHDSNVNTNEANLKKPVILITGCSSGIGNALAELVSHNPYYRVVLTARESSLHLVREKFTETENLMILPLDLTDFDQIKQTVSYVLKNGEPLMYLSIMQEFAFALL